MARRFSVFVLVVAIILAGCGCASGSGENGPGDNTYTIVMATAVTGGMAEVGNAFENSVRMAIDEVNQFNQENGCDWRFALEVYDDKGDITEATLVANRIAQNAERYFAVFGHLLSSTTLACMETYSRAGLPVFVPTANGDEIQGENMLRMCLPATVQGPQVAACAINNCQIKRLALIYAMSDYGIGMTNQLEAFALERNVDVVVKESYTAGTDKDFSAILTKIEAEKADGVAIVGDYNEGSMIIQQAGGIPYFNENDVVFVSDASMFGDVFLERIANCGIEDQIFISAYYSPYNQDPNYLQFSKKFQDQYGVGITEPVVYGYDMVNICAAAIRAGAAKDTLVETVKSLSFDNLVSATGRIQFDQQGNRSVTDISVIGVKDGQFYDTGELVDMTGVTN